MRSAQRHRLELPGQVCPDHPMLCRGGTGAEDGPERTTTEVASGAQLVAMPVNPRLGAWRQGREWIAIGGVGPEQAMARIGPKRRDVPPPDCPAQQLRLNLGVGVEEHPVAAGLDAELAARGRLDRRKVTAHMGQRVAHGVGSENPRSTAEA